MKTSTLRRPHLASPTRPAYRNLLGWALGILIENHAVLECDHHGHVLDRADPDARNRAREAAWSHPFPGATPEECQAAIDEVLGGIGDTCPEC